jgi:hypothetical protein
MRSHFSHNSGVSYRLLLERSNVYIVFVLKRCYVSAKVDTAPQSSLQKSGKGERSFEDDDMRNGLYKVSKVFLFAIEMFMCLCVGYVIIFL